MKSFLQKITPFIVFGIAILIIGIGIIALSYVLIFGALIGLILYAFQWIKGKLVSKQSSPAMKKVESKGQTINHDDI